MAGCGAVATAIGIGMAVWKYFKSKKTKHALAQKALNLGSDKESEVQVAVGKQGYISVDQWYNDYTLNKARVLNAAIQGDAEDPGTKAAINMVNALGLDAAKVPAADKIAKKLRV